MKKCDDPNKLVRRQYYRNKGEENFISMKYTLKNCMCVYIILMGILVNYKKEFISKF